MPLVYMLLKHELLYKTPVLKAANGADVTN